MPVPIIKVSPKRPEIETAILAGEHYDEIGKRYNVSEAAVSSFARRHMNVHRHAAVGKGKGVPRKGDTYTYTPKAGGPATTWHVVRVSDGFARMETGYNGSTRKRWVSLTTLRYTSTWQRAVSKPKPIAAVVPMSSTPVALPLPEPAGPGIPEVLDALGRILITQRQMLAAMQATSNDVAALLNEWVK